MEKSWIAAAAALLVLAACGDQTGTRPPPSASPAAGAASTPGPSALPAPTALPTEEPSDQAPAGVGYSCEAQTGGPGRAGAPSVLRDARVGRHDGGGFDRFVLEFDTATWRYDVVPQGNVFVRDPSGLPVTLDGSAGLRVVVHNATNHDPQGQPVETVLNSTPEFPALRQLAQLGDFEGVLTWGLGIASASRCFRSFVLTSPSRLVVDVQQ
ncbi:MAG TPA: hypothetical protein VFD49_22120 [Candidatus Dormibacteraeota bacterium]|nr:hypothetical protein [Candidatus Dormibacteraeota bacterium]